MSHPKQKSCRNCGCFRPAGPQSQSVPSCTKGAFAHCLASSHKPRKKLYWQPKKKSTRKKQPELQVDQQSAIKEAAQRVEQNRQRHIFRDVPKPKNERVPCHFSIGGQERKIGGKPIQNVHIKEKINEELKLRTQQ